MKVWLPASLCIVSTSVKLVRTGTQSLPRREPPKLQQTEERNSMYSVVTKNRWLHFGTWAEAVETAWEIYKAKQPLWLNVWLVMGEEM